MRSKTHTRSDTSLYNKHIFEPGNGNTRRRRWSNGENVVPDKCRFKKWEEQGCPPHECNGEGGCGELHDGWGIWAPVTDGTEEGLSEAEGSRSGAMDTAEEVHTKTLRGIL